MSVSRETTGTSRRRASRVALSLVTVALVVALTGCSSGGGYTPQAPLTITGGPYQPGQHIDVSVGPNGYFKPYAGIKILECADPGGTVQNLPKNVSACDGNTIQPGSIIINQDGSFSFQGYPVFQLPNATQLGEPDDNRPICNASNECVFYIGQNQEKFTAPKIFSPPFTVSKS